MDLSRVLFDLALVVLLVVVGMGWVALVVECINALLRDRAKGREYRDLLANQAKESEISARKDGKITSEEAEAGWHYCAEFDGMLTRGELPGGNGCLCDK